MNFIPEPPEPGSFADTAARACEDLVRKFNIEIEGLTEKQVAEAFKQAIAAGGFEVKVYAGYDVGGSDNLTHTQAVIYLPGRRVAELEERVAVLNAEVVRLQEALNNATYRGSCS